MFIEKEEGRPSHKISADEITCPSIFNYSWRLYGVEENPSIASNFILDITNYILVTLP